MTHTLTLLVNGAVLMYSPPPEVAWVTVILFNRSACGRCCLEPSPIYLVRGTLAASLVKCFKME